jgi:2'-5' RNA ligase
MEQSYKIAEKFSASGASYLLKRESLPHLTLFHAQLANAPLSYVLEILLSINGSLKRNSLRCNQIVVFRDFYLFWLCEMDIALQSAHEQTLALARFLAPGEKARPCPAQIELTERELDNIKRFGHPWVGSLFSPHITLGFGLATRAAVPVGLKEEWVMKIAAIEFARIEYPGRIVEIVPIRST